MNKIIPILSLLFFTQCYQEPFFELTVQIQDQNSNPVSDVVVKIEITDLDNGYVIEEVIIDEYFEETTNSSGEVSFSFDNKALVTARVCDQNTGSLYCAEGHVYLEENTTRKLELMLQSSEVEHDQCSYCN